MNEVEEILSDLQKLAFRRGIKLNRKDLDYLQAKGIEKVMEHAADFIEKRLVPAEPQNDGKQTPRRNHPVFVAQHATATCCRGCLAKWHDISKGREISEIEKLHILEIIKRWLESNG
jgi:CHAD domain-containing protein